MSFLGINLLAPVLFYQNPIDAFQTYNGSTQVNGLPTEFNSCGRRNFNLASNSPASQYQIQKIIQNTVRVYASLYLSNLASLSAYQKPLNTYQLIDQAGSAYYAPPRVNWNQMSDRARPSVQLVKTGSGSAYGASSTKHTIVRNRPGAMSPGGIGVDIKHNSYDRYLNRLKGKGPLRRGVVPTNFTPYIPFNRAAPVYGGKTFKTNIINDCDCPDIDGVLKLEADKRIYGDALNAINEKILAIGYKFNVGDFVWVKKSLIDTILYKAQIIEIKGDIFVVKFLDDETISYKSYIELYIYFDCNCINTLSIKDKLLLEAYAYSRTNNNFFNESNSVFCNILSAAAATEIL
uniref:Uncharacterized protein n=1 Tax=viral metagenome TaxID=1070528 RepID=A0A6C0KMJ9_9ZZZZ